MKIAEYNEMMAYLTRPEPEIVVLPEPKPQELIEIQEQKKKGRLLDALNKIGGGLEDTSLDFIKRENFSKGSLPKNVQDFLIETFPDVDFDFSRVSKYGVPYNKTNKEAVNLYERVKNAARYKLKDPNYVLNPARQDSQAYTVKKAEEAVKEFKKKNGRLPYRDELSKIIGKSKTHTYRVLKDSNKTLTIPRPTEEHDLMKKNIAEQDKSIKKGMDIIKEDYKKFKKTALPNQKYYVSPNLLSFKDVDGNIIPLSGSIKTRNKIIDNLIEEGLDIARADFSVPATGGEKTTGGLSKEERNYFKKNYKNKSLGQITRKFLPEGTGTTTAPYDKKIAKFIKYRNELVSQKLIKEKDLIKPLEFEPKAPGQSHQEDLERRGKSLEKLGVKNQEEWLSSLKREIADEIYGKKAFVTDERGNTRVRIDQGHRGGYDQFKKLGASYPISSVGPDLDDVNRKNIKLVENKLQPHYKKQVSLYNKAKKNLTSDLIKEIDKNNNIISEIVAEAQVKDPKIKGRIIGVQVDPYNLKVATTPIDYTKALDLGVLDNAIMIGAGTEGKINKALIKENYKSLLLKEGAEQGFLKKGLKIPTADDSKSIAKQLASFGFKCSAAEGGACDNPMAYLDDIKKQQALAKGTSSAAATAAKRISAGKAIFREVLGPAALSFELAAAVPITYLGYKAGLPPARIIADATYGLAGETQKARLKKVAAEEGIDTAEIQKSLDFEKASKNMQTIASQEGEFRGPDDEMQFPQQYEKAEEDFYKSVGAFRDEQGNVSKDVYQTLSDQLKKVRGIISDEDAARAAKRVSDVDFTGIGDYLIGEEDQLYPRTNFGSGSDGTSLAIKESLEAFKRYQDAGGKLSYADFIAFGNEGVSRFFNQGGRVGFADGPDNPKRRAFMKLMAGIASLPILGKFFKGAKTAKVVKLANTTTKMPDWFPAFVDRAFEKGIAKKIDADITEIEVPELPGVQIRKYDDGRIEVEGKNAYNESYEIQYEPPGYEVIDYKTGKAVETKGEFVASDTRYRQTGPELDDVDVDYDTVPEVDDILGGNSTQLEGFAKGTNKAKKTKGEKLVEEADQRSNYYQQERADFDKGPEIDPTDYYYED